MRVVVLGSGNVAYHLVLAMKAAGVDVIQVFGRNEAALREIRQLSGVPFSTERVLPADLYLIAARDEAIAEIAAAIPPSDALVVHTAGAMPWAVLPPGFRRGVLYPLQTFSKSKKLNYGEIPFFLETENAEDYAFLEALARKISSKVKPATQAQRLALHLAAVFAANFSNHLFYQAEKILQSSGYSFREILPLVEETFEKAETTPPYEAQTGPARRGDSAVLQKHEAQLAGDALKIYETLSQSILHTYHPENYEL